MILSPPSFMSENQPKKRAVSSLRSFRLFRVFKLARNWRSLRELLEMIGRAIAGIANFGVLFFIFIYIYALVGMQFFGNTMRFDDSGYPTPYNINEYWFGTVPRLNFDTFLWSSITVFKIITTDNWNENMYDVIRSNGMPLRVISRRPGLKLVVNALIEAIPAVFNVLIVCALFYLVFSIFAVNYLKGKLNSCTGNAFDALSDDQVQFLVNPDPWSSLSLEQQQWFTNTTCPGFPTDALTSKYLCGCWACIDATDVDMQPIRDNNMGWAAFFVVFMMFGSFFVVNLFVGVIIENFNKMQDALGGSFMLTSEQKKWLKAQKTASHVGPQLILKPFKDPHFGQPTLQTTILAILNDIFAAIFTIEAALKLVAYGFTYFRDTWNQFDFFVVVGTLVSIAVESLTTTHLRSLAILARVFRVTRIIRLVKSFKGIRHILITLYLAVPGLSNATSILVLMLFIYTTMGVQMFAKVALSDNIDAHANFQSFGRGFLLMIRAATGESWDYCMHDFAGTTQGCVDDPPYDPTMCGFNNSDDCIPLNGCGNPIAYLFFCSFTLLGTYVMLNVTVAVILESFSVSNEDEEPLFDPEVLSEFQIKWAEVDPQAKGYIPVAKLHAICTILEEPLVSSDALRDKRSFLKFVTGLGLPMYEGETVYFTDTLLAMTREMVKAGVQDELNAIGSVTPSMEDMRSRQRLHYQAHDYFAARQIQRSVSGWLRCKRQLEKEYMEEYKSKIKKPSVRPKKQRGALVVTTG
ncbi:Sodium channel protein 60E [Phytophthora ramorum]|uniref:Sodium channel protein 60E n=1 Tax=Phytophthora ramorum TaxID=164328 RepID=UPI0030ABFDC0|nr:Sodium channel protein 60E [Phytophthora ramorum]